MRERTLSERMHVLWSSLYGKSDREALENFLARLEELRLQQQFSALEPEWYKDAIIYSLYVDLFAEDFAGLTSRLDYLANLGVNCLWLLPILDSPMRDAGFDIRDYRKVRPDLLVSNGKEVSPEQQMEIFGNFMDMAHEKGIRVIFDIAINHTSDEHPWFSESRKSPDNPYRDYYIWNRDDKKYADARIIFYGIEDSNWKKDGEEYFFHRFFDFQPDLNYKNPTVLLEMAENMIFWLKQGVDGFRADAIPYLWKEEGTDCENLPGTHMVVKFLRAVLEYLRPNTLLLAEACQKPHQVVQYFGNGDECNAGYHFPLMPQIFKAVAQNNRKPIVSTLSRDVTPDIPGDSQWLTFLRCHDELSLELVYVTEDDRAYIHGQYCRKPEWDFRKGQGISARLSELMERDPDRISLITSVMLTLPGTPVIYYGDEFGKLNDVDYYREKIHETGKDDTRFLVRGRIDWPSVEQELDNPSTFTARVFESLSGMIRVRKAHRAFGRGTVDWIQATGTDGKPREEVLIFTREFQGERLLIIHNLSGTQQVIRNPLNEEIGADLLNHKILINKDMMILRNWQFHWISLGE